MSCKTNLCDKITKLWLFDCLDIKCPFDKLVIFSLLIHPVIASIFKSKIPPDLNFDLQRYSKKPYIFKLKKTQLNLFVRCLDRTFWTIVWLFSVTMASTYWSRDPKSRGVWEFSLDRQGNTFCLHFLFRRRIQSFSGL